MDASFPMSSFIRQVTMHVNVTGVRTAQCRMWIGTWLIRLAARVIGCGIEIR